jgi:hypothetical protein
MIISRKAGDYVVVHTKARAMRNLHAPSAGTWDGPRSSGEV